MIKALLQGAFSVLLFFATWFALEQVDWVGVFRLESVSRKTEHALGELIWNMVEGAESVIEDEDVVSPIDSIVSRICSANGLDKDFIKLHILNNETNNAFALPDGHLVVYTGLIENAMNPEELTAVLGHEIGHIEGKHVMQKLAREIGVSIIISTTTGGGPEVISQILKLLSSTAFDRSLEKEADLKSVDFLLKAGINPEPFADFLARLGEEEEGDDAMPSWVNTHPDSKDRAAYIREYIRGKEVRYEPVMSAGDWTEFKKAAER